ncbi:bifunctional [glutamine synthetase] adenylyltransferase/[glutamine synthetase]-adenylyl-L-tyrosine phosphorylase [Acetobacteraceae bacterium KSS8]|uniref:Bifunctional [glutamine synthetase] adenylyltransferase/[glutamine synthetase]-adenylyl-L-tyrosine phosphorylase n=1 Tax=Endosaccharibacter trunci TaxID=2812733 RepID=A0ABT1W239_9PROT|nr:bifunctional [glutamine synthetase] adenylyltransferase/[glutamine synthetase]-adenylyl-L-tyrosine phosphorylase [Acetobacteraceae bacterium KSS8]
MTGFRLPDAWPPPSDPHSAALLVEAIGESLNVVDANPGAGPGTGPGAIDRMLRAIGGNSRYLSDLAQRESALLSGFVRHGPARTLAASLRQLRHLVPTLPRHEIAAGLRRAKRQVALVAALADLGGLWSLGEVTGALSLLAEAALRVAAAHLLHAAHAAGQIALPDPARPEKGSGLVVLGMGKLGARELNYSSDIDLVLIYDPDLQNGRDDLSRVFSRIATGLVSLMEAQDADGYVFRTDLRLRPDPGATPPAVSLPAALTYYESYGRTWERAAMIKARPVAGDLDAGARFLQAIRPFIWRRHLDFAAIDDIHAMKRRIDRDKPAPSRGFSRPNLSDPVSALLGHDLKLGHGGIREIEFIAQTLLLVWAGRSPALRDPTTLGALRKLAEAGHLKPDRAEALSRTYTRLRGLEHRLQMLDDRQTHSLPADRARFGRFAVFAGEAALTGEHGEPDLAAAADHLAASLLPELRRTRARFESMLRPPAMRDGDQPPDGLAEGAFDPDAPEAEVRLGARGFQEPRRVLEILRGWQTDRYRALRAQRARTILSGLVPALLAAFAAQPDPDGVLLRFDTLLSRQNAGVQLLSLLERTPALLDRIAAILGASSTLSDHLAAVPGALDGLLEPEPAPLAGRTVMRNLDGQMRAAAHVEDAIRIARTLVRAEEFRIAVAELDGALGTDAAARARTALADRVINHMLRVVVRDHRRRYGTIPGGTMGVVALGKCGSREMMAGSDLDLMLIYDHPAEVTESVPAPGVTRTLPPSLFFTRLAHALIAALSAPGVEGPLYALDMRLRPSGSKGPVAVSLQAFRRYHRSESWTWERMALTRARVVAAPPALRRAIDAALADALRFGEAGSVDPASIRSDAAEMRRRLLRDLPPRSPWDAKLRPGGLMEVEFIAQSLQLIARAAEARHPTARIAFRRLARAGTLSAADARALIKAERFWRTLQSRLRLLLGMEAPKSLAAALPPAAIASLLDGFGWLGPDRTLDSLSDACEAMASNVRALFERLVGPVDQHAPLGARQGTGRS